MSKRKREQRKKNLFNLCLSLAAIHSKLLYFSMVSWLMVLYFPKLYWVEVTDGILPVSVFCLSEPEIREDINMHRGNGDRCLTLRGIYGMWPSPRYSAFCLLTIFHMNWKNSEKKMPAGDLCNSSGVQQTDQCLTTLSAVNQGSDSESQTRKEHEVIQVVLTSTWTAGMAAEMFYHFR